MIHDATVEVTCDGEKCMATVVIALRWMYRNMSPESGYYDASDKEVERRLVHEAWSVVDGKHYCEECVPGPD